MKIKRTDKEIDKVINRANQIKQVGTTKYPDLTYEEGVRNTLLWIIGDNKDNPMSNLYK